MSNLATRATRATTRAKAPTCPSWCNDHEADSLGHIHVAKAATIAAGAISMQQAVGPMARADGQPEIWLNDELISMAAASELSAILAALVAAGLGSAGA